MYKKQNFVSADYWENRYRSGGNSGQGSYGEYCSFKSEVINGFLSKNDIQSTIEFGCGDGNQLSNISYNRYIGFDVSETIIKTCRIKFGNKENYEFTTSISSLPLKSDLTLSLDVIYHLIEDNVYGDYLTNLFNKSAKHVIIYSSNFEKQGHPHVKHREFLKDVFARFPEFKHYDTISPPEHLQTTAEFYFFKRDFGNV